MLERPPAHEALPPSRGSTCRAGQRGAIGSRPTAGSSAHTKFCNATEITAWTFRPCRRAIEIKAPRRPHIHVLIMKRVLLGSLALFGSAYGEEKKEEKVRSRPTSLSNPLPSRANPRAPRLRPSMPRPGGLETRWPPTPDS